MSARGHRGWVGKFFDMFRYGAVPDEGPVMNIYQGQRIPSMTPDQVSAYQDTMAGGMDPIMPGRLAEGLMREAPPEVMAQFSEEDLTADIVTKKELKSAIKYAKGAGARTVRHLKILQAIYERKQAPLTARDHAYALKKLNGEFQKEGTKPKKKPAKTKPRHQPIKARKVLERFKAVKTAAMRKRKS